MIKNLTWFVFLLLVLFMGFQGRVLQCSNSRHYTIVQLETARQSQGQAILHAWDSIRYGKGTMLDLVRSNTHWDFLFIICYVSLIMMESNAQMQRERWLFLNELLRLNLLLALLAGLCDVAENTMLLHNFRHVSDGRYYLETFWVTYPKFIFAFWAVVVWLVSVVKSGVIGLFGAKVVAES